MTFATKAVANALLNKAASSGLKITPLKLQKLLYYAAGYYAGAYNEPLLDRAFEAWQYGPVVPTIYAEFKDFGDGVITRPATSYDPEIGDFVPVPFPSDQKMERVLDFVLKTYGDLSALELSDMTHREGSPWDKTRKKNPGIKNADIQFEVLKEHFAPLIRQKAA